jgi:uncharacterized delta-60 repeat protein
MPNNTKLIAKLTAVLLMTCLPNFTFAQYLDNTFGTGGHVNTSLGSFGNMCNSVVIQSDQKIVFGGSTKSSDFTDFAFAIARCNSDGTLDNTFGTEGKVVTSIEPGSEGNSVAIQSDGKILLGGSSRWFINLVRYNSDGSLDTAFGTGGKVITDIEGYYGEKCKSVALQSDGKILLGGYGQHNSSDKPYFILVRYNTNGTLDDTFGTGGKIIGRAGQGRSLIIQNDGKILLGGGSNFTFALVRYNANGILDTTFGTGGEVITAVGSSGEGNSLGIQSDGKIVLGGYADSNFALVRYNTDGSLDNTFGLGGRVTTVIGTYSAGKSIGIQNDGKIVLGGYAEADFALVRYNSNGTLDNTFGNGGKVITPIGVVFNPGNSLDIQNDEKIVMGGDANNGDMALVRYNSALVGIEETDSKLFVSKIYPNPFNSVVTIQFNNPLHNAELMIFNIFGQEVKKITNFSGQEIQLFRNNLPGGIYFLGIIVENKIITSGKLVISDN